MKSYQSQESCKSKNKKKIYLNHSLIKIKPDKVCVDTESADLLQSINVTCGDLNSLPC